MQYEPLKKSMGRFFSGPLFLRKLLYNFLDFLLLRSWHIRKALRRIRRELPDNASILDAGSGMGQYSWRMRRMNSRWTITGIDINSSETEGCSDFFRRAGMSERAVFRNADLCSFREAESFDLILSVDVMEHIMEDELVFSNFYNSLKKNGFLLISTPSDRGGSDVHEKNDESFIEEHVRSGYSMEEIEGKLSRAGFSDVSTEYTYGKPGHISWLLSMKYPVKILGISKFFFILLPFYYAVFFPVSLILNYFDLRLKHHSGTGLLVTAKKR